MCVQTDVGGQLKDTARLSHDKENNNNKEIYRDMIVIYRTHKFDMYMLVHTHIHAWFVYTCKFPQKWG